MVLPAYDCDPLEMLKILYLTSGSRASVSSPIVVLHPLLIQCHHLLHIDVSGAVNHPARAAEILLLISCDRIGRLVERVPAKSARSVILDR